MHICAYDGERVKRMKISLEMPPKCVCAHNVSGHGIGCQAIRTPYIYSDKHTSAHEAIQVSPPNLSRWLTSLTNNHVCGVGV